MAVLRLQQSEVSGLKGGSLAYDGSDKEFRCQSQEAGAGAEPQVLEASSTQPGSATSFQSYSKPFEPVLVRRP